MKKAIVGKKIGMTQVFTEDGRLVPVTVIEAGPCTVVQKKTVETDGYEAVQVGFGALTEKRAEKLLTKPEVGHYKKAGVGSLSANSDPSRVFKNKHMAGHYGVDRVTIQNLEIVQVDAERNLLLVKGAVPGPNGGLLIVRNTCKA